MKLDVGCGTSKRTGFVGMDVLDHPAVDIRHDLRVFPWPIQDDSVTELWMDNVIEHLPDTVRTFEEIHRIVRADGRATILYPWYRSYGAFGDPTHVHFFNDLLVEYFLEESFGGKYLYTRKFFRLLGMDLHTYPFLRWMPNRVRRFVSRHLALDIVHGCTIIVQPKK